MGLGLSGSYSSSKQHTDATNIQGGSGDYGMAFKNGTGVMGAKVFGTQLDTTMIGVTVIVGGVLFLVAKGKL
jgi:hypothetical protein